MFICTTKCCGELGITDTDLSRVSLSTGSCEVCGLSRVCADIPQSLIPMVEPDKMTAGNYLIYFSVRVYTGFYADAIQRSFTKNFKSFAQAQDYIAQYNNRDNRKYNYRLGDLC